jgi:hypothetical protein
VDHFADGSPVTAVADAGYHFVEWSDGSNANPRTDTNVIGPIAVTASFAINQYTVSYAAGAHGTLSGASLQTVNYGASGSQVTAVPMPVMCSSSGAMSRRRIREPTRT